MKSYKRLISVALYSILLLGVFSAVSCNSNTQNSDTPTEIDTNTVRAVVVSSDLKRGDVIQAKDVAIADVAPSELPESYFSKRADTIGRTLLADVSAGECLYEEILAEKSDPNTLKQKDLDKIKEDLRNELSEKIREDLLSELQHEIASGGINAADLGYVIVTDYVQANTGKDVSSEIQAVIDANPRKTVFFPDGEYILANPICTSANPENAVSLQLSSFAVLKASDDWSHTEAMVRLGASEPYNNIHLSGSNYYFSGGVIDGNKVANGISIDSGRETVIKNTSIKHTQIGLHIKKGANNSSSDADIEMVNIAGNNMPDSIGVLIEGADNTLKNMRIAAVQTGVLIKRAGNSLRDIHPLFIFASELASKNDMYDSIDRIDFKKSVAFDDQSGGVNWYDFCYSDQMATGFRLAGGSESILQNCFVMWYSNSGDKQVAFECTGKFNASILSPTVYFLGKITAPAFLAVGEDGGYGIVENPYFNPYCTSDESYKKYLTGQVRNPNAK